MQLIIVLHNIRSTYNVGAILRTAEGFGASRVILSGYTPRVNDRSLLPHLREKLNHEIHKTALGAEEMLDIYSSDDINKMTFTDDETFVAQWVDGYQVTFYSEEGYMKDYSADEKIYKVNVKKNDDLHSSFPILASSYTSDYTSLLLYLGKKKCSKIK